MKTLHAYMPRRPGGRVVNGCAAKACKTIAPSPPPTPLPLIIVSTAIETLVQPCFLTQIDPMVRI